MLGISWQCNKAKGPHKDKFQFLYQQSLIFEKKLVFSCYLAVKATQNTFSFVRINTRKNFKKLLWKSLQAKIVCLR